MLRKRKTLPEINVKGRLFRTLEYALMPCPFTGPKIFCGGKNILSHLKNWTAFSASLKTFVLAQKPIN